jgi:hypothetical protein
MLGKRIINTATEAGAACTTDTVQILDGAPFQSIATYQLDGNANDLTTNYNGTASNVTYSTGKFGQAGDFNGSSSYIDTTYTVPAVSTQSISVWFKTTSTGSYRTIFSDAPSNGAAVNTRMQIYTTPTSTYDVIIGNNSGYWIGTGNSISSYIDGNWHNLIATYNGTDVKIYIDGSLFQSFTSTIPFGTAGNQSLVLGKAGLNNVNYWNGSLDQVRIYDKAISAADVTTLYNETVATASTNITLEAPSLVAYYKMSDATDETGSYDGTPTNVNFNVAGKFGNAGDFNGSSSKIDLPNGTGGTGAITVSTWVNTNNISTTQGLWSFGSVPNTASYAVECLIENGYLFFRTLNSAGTAGFQIQTSTGHISNNTWHNIICVFPNTTASNACKIYIDGTERATGTSTLGSITRNTLNNGLGGRFYSGSLSLPLNGKIDQVRIFDRAITANEVTTLYNEVYCQPTIVPTDHFEPVIYTGNGSSQSISTLDFQPDLVWIKQRNDSTHWHILNDSLRGAGYRLFSNEVNAESYYNLNLQSFDSNGFTVGSDTDINENTGTYVAWNWKAGGADVQNTDGTITSQVSANTDAGFSIVKYTGNNTNGATVGHGLSSTPEMFIVKRLEAAEDWAVYHKYADATAPEDYVLILNTAAAASDNNLRWNDTAPTNLVFSLGTSAAVNGSSEDYIAYCFHSVDGMSKFGSYVGTGAAGNSIVTGFRPAFVMIKRTSASGSSWAIFDNKRGVGEPSKVLYANLSDSEYSDNLNDIEFSSNGFTLLDNNEHTNYSSNTYIFMAFAEEVFVPDNFFNDDSTLATYKLNGDTGDDSGNGYNGTASNVTYATGKFDKAAVFNGSSSYISAANILDTSSAFSYSFWINPSTISSLDYVIGHQQAGSPYAGISLLGSGSNKLFLSISGGTAQDMTPSLSLNTWSHIVLTHDGSGNYVCYTNNNGSPISYSGATSNNSSNPFRLGFSSVSGWGYFEGKIDQVRIFNKALDAGEVTQLYNE